MNDIEIIAEGWWCRECEFFETEDPTGRCSSCGCAGGEHVVVKVVTA